ncbi:MAG: DUF1598 domain-containing protein [Pirellulales bacterium]
MLSRVTRRTRWSLLALGLVGLGLLSLGGWSSTAWAGSALLRNSAVGGVSISVDGVLSETPAEVVGQSRQSWEEFLKGAPGGMQGATEIRKVSVRGLEHALAEAVQQGGEVPESVRFLGGLQRIQYVMVYPAADGKPGDIVLAGPAEGWQVDERGNVVGVTTRQPVLQLDDLLVALRSVRAAKEGAVNCSIDPTPEGVQNVQRLLKQVGRSFSPEINQAIEQACGMQTISVDGVPETSHFARVMVAADYRMKRIAMGLDDSSVDGLPSYLQILKTSRARINESVQPRWWLACNYQPLSRSEDGLAWQLRGPGVKVMTEENHINGDGSITASSGRANPLAQKWADQMTNVYDQLAQRELIFAELRNIMDLSVVAALIEKEGLADKAGLKQLPNLLHDATPDSYHAPKTLATQCAIVKRNGGYVFMASGGVQIDSWQATEQAEVNASLGELHAKARSTDNATDWWWN